VNAISAISSTSSFVVRTAIVRRHELVLLALLLAETFYLSVTLDTQPLIQIQSIWGTVIGWAPQYLRLAIAMAALMLLLGGRRFMVALMTPREHMTTEARLQLVGVHLLAVLTLASISSVVFAAGPSGGGSTRALGRGLEPVRGGHHQHLGARAVSGASLA
jgi:hypothetical protein